MLKSHKLQLEQSELREKINGHLNREAALEDGDREELGQLTKRAQSLELELRAALTAEGMESETRTMANDAEGREVRGLLDSLSISDYLTPASAGQGLDGRAKELNEALKLPVVGGTGATPIPWQILETREARESLETRAFTDSGDYAGGIGQRPILQRLFGGDLMSALGVRIDSVPVGRTEWPLITGGVAPAQKAEGAAANDAVAVTFATETLKPKRLTGSYEFTHEMAVQVTDLEGALRRDLADAVKAKMSDQILNGDEATNSQEVDGFLTTLTAPTAPSAVAAFADYAGIHAQAVDGIHASMEGEVSSVIGVASYKHAATVYQTGSGESGAEALKRRSRQCMASSFVPAAASMVQDGNILHAAGPNGGEMRGDSVAAVWPTLEIIRDIHSNASQGVVLTWVTLWDAQTAFRSGAYKRASFQIA